MRLQGRVRAVGPDEGKPVLEQVTVEVDGQSTSWTAPPREFDLVDESGQAVRIEVPREVQVEAAATRRSGAWSELHEACCPDPEDLAAPFAKAKLVSRAIRAGDQVEVYGDRRSGRRGRGGLQRQPAAARPHGLRSDHHRGISQAYREATDK